jgi:hypothetical protein
MYKKSAAGSRAVPERWFSSPPVGRIAAIFFLTSCGGIPIISHTINEM